MGEDAGRKQQLAVSLVPADTKREEKRRQPDRCCQSSCQDKLQHLMAMARSYLGAGVGSARREGGGPVFLQHEAGHHRFQGHTLTAPAPATPSTHAGMSSSFPYTAAYATSPPWVEHGLARIELRMMGWELICQKEEIKCLRRQIEKFRPNNENNRNTLCFEIGNLVFDKDDQLAVEFVTAAANIRGHSFGIPLHNLFEAKGVAGNIVHAVATTNAIIAGLIVIEAIKVLRGDYKNYRMTYCPEHPTRKLLLMPVESFEPDKSCYVCSETPLLLDVNTKVTKPAL